MALTLTATPQPNTTPPSALLTIANNSSATTAVVTRIRADGSSGTVRTPTGDPLAVPANSTVTLVDTEPPYGQQLTYLVNGVVVAAPIVVNADSRWLVHVGNPSLSMPILVAADTEEAMDVEQGVFWPVGGQFPIVVTDGTRRAPASTMTIRTTTQAEWRALQLLLADATALLYNVPTALGPGEGARYIAPGRLTRARVVPYGPVQLRHWTLAYQEVESPVGGTLGLVSGGGGTGGGGTVPIGTRTWADLALEAPTWAAVAAKYSTWGAAATGAS